MNGKATLTAPSLVCDVFAIDERQIRKVKSHAVSAESARRVADTFRLLGQETRVRIVDALTQGELCVCDLSVLLDMKISAVSHQLALLKQHNIVRGRRSGKMIYYSLDDDHVRELFGQCLEHHSHTSPPKGTKART
jgi:ArsR family transcriptional regulator, lead/cadmium/zinc/bismuth-responsive transcriptional repressor